MTNLAEQSQWDAGIYQIEQTDPVVGGPPNLALGEGINNVQAQQLANRTSWLKVQVEALQAAGLTGADILAALLTVDGHGSGLDADKLDGKYASEFATPADVQAGIDALVAAAPGALDTLNELAAALGNDPDFATTITNLIATKLNSSAFTGAAVLALLLPVDGAGSGLDADTLDGYEASALVNNGVGENGAIWRHRNAVRANATDYENNTNRPIMVSVGFNSIGECTAKVGQGPGSYVTVIIEDMDPYDNQGATWTFIVPAGQWYRIDLHQTATTIFKWAELG